MQRRGFTFPEVMLIVVIVGLVAAVAIPRFAQARHQSMTNACLNNLRQMDSAKEGWALETKKSPGSPVDAPRIVVYLKGGIAPSCPAGGIYSWNPVGKPPSCSIPGHTL